MIHTLTFSPSIDLTLAVPESLRLGEAQRLDTPTEYAGGKGMNVSVALEHLGIPTVAWVFLGGDRGARWKRLAASLNVEIESVPVKSETRQNIKIFEESLPRQTDLNFPGPLFEQAACETFLARLQKRIAKGDFVVLAGSTFRDAPTGWWSKLAEKIDSVGARFVVDTSGQTLVDLGDTNPWAIKINRLEFNEWRGIDCGKLDEVAEYLTRTGGIGTRLIVTDGAEGSMGWMEEGNCFHVKPPSVEVRGTVGAGDAFTAGWLAGWIERKGDGLLAMKWGNAAAAGAVELPGTSFPVRERVLELIKEVV